MDRFEVVRGAAMTDQPGSVLRSSRDVMLQRTLGSAVSCKGQALHSGADVSIVLNPAPVDHGIVFQRTDIPGMAGRVVASWDNVVNTSFCTVIGNEFGATVSTIEHLMAALAGCGVDNVLIQIDGSELPVMDGSAAPFVFLVECAGTVAQDAPRRALKIKRRVTVEADGKRVELVPARDFQIHFRIEFDGTIGRQDYVFGGAAGAFKAELSRARTFTFAGEIEQLHAAGLALGGSLDNAVVIEGDRVLNDGGLRYADECVRHKVLDCLGDLYTVGGPIIGHYHGLRAGHGMTNRLLKALFADAANYEWVDLQQPVSRQPVLTAVPNTPPVRPELAMKLAASA